MSRFEKGMLFKLICRPSPTNMGVPWVNFHVFGTNDTWFPCNGKVDTGADLTIFTKLTADLLGIGPDDGEERHHIWTATGQKVDYYLRLVQIKFGVNGQGYFQSVGFVFDDKLKRDLLGKDWLKKFCLVFDSRTVSLIEECTGLKPSCADKCPDKICLIP